MANRGSEIHRFYADYKLPFWKSAPIVTMVGFSPLVLVFFTLLGAEKDAHNISMLNLLVILFAIGLTGWVCDRVRFHVPDKVPCGLTFANWLGLRYGQDAGVRWCYRVGFLVSQFLFLICQFALLIKELSISGDYAFVAWVFGVGVLVMSVLTYFLAFRVQAILAYLVLIGLLGLILLHLINHGGWTELSRGFGEREIFRETFRGDYIFTWIGISFLFAVGVSSLFLFNQQIWQVGFATRRRALDRGVIAGAGGAVVLALAALASGVVMPVTKPKLELLTKGILIDSLENPQQDVWAWLMALVVAGIFSAAAAQTAVASLVAFDFGWSSEELGGEIGPAQGERSGETWVEISESEKIREHSRRGRIWGLICVVAALILACLISLPSPTFNVLGFVLGLLIIVDFYLAVPVLMMVFSEDGIARRVLNWGLITSAFLVLVLLLIIIIILSIETEERGIANNTLIICGLSYVILDVLIWYISYRYVR